MHPVLEKTASVESMSNENGAVGIAPAGLDESAGGASETITATIVWKRSLAWSTKDE